MEKQIESLKNKISKLAQLKANELGIFKEVRYSIDGQGQVTRVTYEMMKIQRYFDNNNYDDNFILIYLKELKIIIEKNNIKIYDYLPFSIPNVTTDFLSWIDKSIISIELEQLNISEESEKYNPFPRIFVSCDAFNFFERLKENVNNRLADFSFIFRKMQRDELIYTELKESEFRNWLNENYEISIEKLKLYDYCKTPAKESLYYSLK